MILYKDDKMTVYKIHDNVYYLDAPRFLDILQQTAIRGKVNRKTKGTINKIVLTYRDVPYKGFVMTILPIESVVDAKKEKVIAIAKKAFNSTL